MRQHGLLQRVGDDYCGVLRCRGFRYRHRIAVSKSTIADFVLVDLDTPYTVDKNKLHSKSHNCPFDGAQLYGRVCATVKGGELTYQAEE